MLFKDKLYDFHPAIIPITAEKTFLNIAYASDTRQRLDIYLPAGKKRFPVIVDIYGGGLLRGQKSSEKLNPSLRFLSDGFAVVSLDYRLNRQYESQFPNQIIDIRAALQYLIAHAQQYQLDTHNITLIGESSGAQLAVLAAATFSKKYTLGTWADTLTNQNFPAIASVIGLYGPYQVDQFTRQFQELNIQPQFQETGTAQSFEGIMLHDHAPASVPDLVAQSNPATYFSKDMPPLMLIAGKKDPVVPYLQSVQLADSYRQVTGHQITTHWVDNGVHGPKDYDNTTIHASKLAFIQKYQKP